MKAEKSKTEKLVYFLWCAEASRFKIGSSGNTKKRKKNLSTGNPFELELVFTLPGGEAKEKELHRKFEACHLHKEWYRWSERLQAYVDGVLDGQAARPSAPKSPGLIQPPKPAGTAKKDKYATVDLPHGNDMRKVVEIVGYVARREAFPYGERHDDYYLHAARILGFIRKGVSVWSTTPAGRTLLALERGSSAERDLIVGQMSRHALLRWACLETPRTMEEIVEHILKSYDVTPKTAKRRAACLIAWRKFANNHHKEPQ